MRGETASYLLLRIGVAFALLYPPVAALFEPVLWVGYFPQFTSALPVSYIVLLHMFGAVETVAALWILSGWRIFYPSLFAAVLLLLITAFNFSQFSILFRDVALAFAALSLALWNYPLSKIHKRNASMSERAFQVDRESE